MLFDGEMYAQFEYDERGNLKAMYKNELEIPTSIDNGASVNVLPKAFYDKHKILHNLPKVSANMQPIMTGNGSYSSIFLDRSSLRNTRHIFATPLYCM